LVLSLPLMFILSFCFMPDSWSNIGAPALLSLAYVSIFSMLIGFVFWYRGLAQGGIAAVGQLQLLQPFFGLLLAAMILHEKAGWELAAVNVGVIACVAAARQFANQSEKAEQ
ncbi:EamA family transporter, partial [Bacillus velezensis]